MSGRPKATATSGGKARKLGRPVGSLGLGHAGVATPESIGKAARAAKRKVFPPKRRRRKCHKPLDKRGNGTTQNHGQTGHEFDAADAVVAAVLAHLKVPQKMIASAVGVGSVNTLKKHYGEIMDEGMRVPVAMARGAMFRRSMSDSVTPAAVRAGLAVLEEFDGWNAHKRQSPKGNGSGAKVIDQREADIVETMKLAYQEMPEEQRPTVREFLALVQKTKGEAGD